jgi:hypothetical protein
MVNLASSSFEFTGQADMGLLGLELMELQHTGAGPILHKGTENGVSLMITRDPKSSDTTAIVGKGEEAATGRKRGCFFLCSGVKEREADVVKMCKSVRIKRGGSKAAP